MKYIEFVCSKVKGRDGNSQVAAVLGAIRKHFDEYVIRFPEKENFMSDSSSSNSNSEGHSPSPAHVNHIFGVLKDYYQFIQSSNQPAKKSDLDCYLEEPILPWSQDFSALTWWRTTGAKYPTLSKMARDFLAVSYEASFYTEPRPTWGSDQLSIAFGMDIKFITVEFHDED
ncbi:unnamed protein product [Prunus armeniaca]|uniref:HAT C-terminal dimerisation domain-containing protein n=1 Tax=Prunus armeniaca TaxID=36596 RepID=A0A6J5VYG7_PRUAR|nr:unnamed protein product [Prunus armeniaca]